MGWFSEATKVVSGTGDMLTGTAKTFESFSGLKSTGMLKDIVTTTSDVFSNMSLEEQVLNVGTLSLYGQAKTVATGAGLVESAEDKRRRNVEDAKIKVAEAKQKEILEKQELMSEQKETYAELESKKRSQRSAYGGRRSLLYGSRAGVSTKLGGE